MLIQGTMLALLLACAGSEDQGAVVYADECESCHGADGTLGVQMNGVPAASLPDVVPALDDEALRGVIDEGEGEMPAQHLDPPDVADCIAWLRATFP